MRLSVALIVAALAVASGNGHLIGQQSTSFDVVEKSIGELQTALAGGRVTSARLVELYLDRIRAYDQVGPRLNVVLHLNVNATREARDLDAERKRRGPRGPLHGIPVLLKDNFDTRDMPTTGGSLALSGVVPAEDAYQVKRLRQAGAVILGKVNLHELALGLTTVSSLGGQTLNPYDVTRSPGGSSGGSGVAAAASFAAVTLGTDTSGSIRIPSSHNSLVGLRPTAGLSSRAGIIPFGHTQDTGGPMARSVSDVAIVLDATAGYDPADPVTALGKGRIPTAYTSALRADALSGARVGVLREFFGTAPEDEPVAAIVRQAVEDMKARGATAVDIVVPNLTQQLTASSLLTQELKFDLRDYLRRSRGARIKSLEELLSSGLHTAQFQGFVEGANALARRLSGQRRLSRETGRTRRAGTGRSGRDGRAQARRARVSDGPADRAARRRQSGRLERRAVRADRISGNHGARRVHGRLDSQWASNCSAARSRSPRCCAWRSPTRARHGIAVRRPPRLRSQASPATASSRRRRSSPRPAA